MLKTESELLMPLSNEQLEQYNRDGFIIIKNGCSSDLIDAFNRHIFEIRSAPLDETPDWARTSEKARFSSRLFNPHQHDSFSRQVMKLPIVRGALAQLMKKEAVCVQSMFFYKEPGSQGQAAHQDFYYIKNDPMTMIAAWIAMEDKVDEQNGCLWVIPGTHKLGLLPHGKVKDLVEHEEHTHETEGINLKEQIPVIMEKGDVLFFHELLIHSSNRNRSTDRWRRSYVCHYIREDSAVTLREDLREKYSLK
ncbi:phytanoyl-CoA dioxygenase family protein [Bacillus sp. FJAT-28004]|uniref:phytanoyl-CoA dioxygenase family protein n=1 Tax=Bacillus sp. FJAT-28004 TaxID=1679165 RepID=UPI0006B67D43|nr:phytanoyl-CoA dioxygenase family protein [Bacillus sp. FJAT-28004]